VPKSASGGRLVYLDTSAFTKLVAEEKESAALRRHLAGAPLRTSALLLQTEALRAAARLSPQHLALAQQQLRGIAYLHMDRPLYSFAGALTPPELRSLDALHIAAALTLSQDLAEFVTYDERMVRAASVHGLPVVSPS
jgi:predicted nucleic acid-binding protein